MKLLFSNKSVSGDKINLTKNEVAEVFDSFLSNKVKNLKIPQYSNFDPIVRNIEDPTLKALVKYKNHPRILAIRPKHHMARINLILPK